LTRRPRGGRGAMGKPTVMDAAQRLPASVRMKFIAAFNACHVMDLYRGDAASYMAVIAETVRDRGAKIEVLEKLIAKAKKALDVRTAATPTMVGQLTHTRSCPGLILEAKDDCTCGLIYRVHLQTEQTMHAAWRKRAEEAETDYEALSRYVRDVEAISIKWQEAASARSAERDDESRAALIAAQQVSSLMESLKAAWRARDDAK